MFFLIRFIIIVFFLNMSSQLPKPFAEATPNSSQLAEILLQLKEDDGITRLVQNHNNGFSLSQQTVS